MKNDRNQSYSNYRGGQQQHPVRHTLFDYIASPVKSPNENGRGIIPPLAHVGSDFASRLRGEMSGGGGSGPVQSGYNNNYINSSPSAWPAARSSKFNTPVKAPPVRSPLSIDSRIIIPPTSSNENEEITTSLTQAAAPPVVAVEVLELESKENVSSALKEMCFECVEKSLEARDIERLTTLAQFYSKLILG